MAEGAEITLSFSLRGDKKEAAAKPCEKKLFGRCN